MLPNAEMVPKECGFNQSQTACGFCAGIAWRFPCPSTTARYGELVEMQHSCHHVDTIRHPNSSYVTTKLYGTTTCGCNNNTIFSERTSYTFPTFDVRRARWPGSGEALVNIMPKWKDGNTVEFIIFAFLSFLHKYCVKYYNYIVKWCSEQWDII